MVTMLRQPTEERQVINLIEAAENRTAGLIAGFDPISLAEMTGVALLNRVDTKYLMGVSDLWDALDQVSGQYRVLSIGSRRLHHYQTLYFDTPDFALYQQHHNGMGTRYKVRVRKYVESGLAFFEVKHKTNQRRMIKPRFQIHDLITEIDEPSSAFVDAHTPFHGEELEPKLWNEFSRITLVSKHRQERVTLDLNLQLGWQGMDVFLPGLAIAEVKQPHFSQQSDLVQQLHRLGIRPGPFSKYCMGVCLLYENVKSNNFKPNSRRMYKIIEKEFGREPVH